MPDIVNPLATAAPYYVLLEASSSGPLDLEALVGGFLEFALEEGMILDGVRASSVAQAQKIWAIREGVVEAQVKHGTYLRTDVSVPISKLADFVRDALTNLDVRLPDALAVTYGHVGDGNIHMNVVPPEGMEATAVDRLFHEAEALIFGALTLTLRFVAVNRDRG